VIRRAGKGSGDVPKRGAHLRASTPRGWYFLGVTVEGNVVVVIGIGVNTTGCIGDGVHGLNPIAVVGLADCPTWSSMSNLFNIASEGTHLGTFSHFLLPVRLAVRHPHGCRDLWCMRGLGHR
jgi:hypothetical protein